MFINAKQVKKYLHDQNKQISKEALESLNFRVQSILSSAVINVKGFKRITPTEINFTRQ